MFGAENSAVNFVLQSAPHICLPLTQVELNYNYDFHGMIRKWWFHCQSILQVHRSTWAINGYMFYIFIIGKPQIYIYIALFYNCHSTSILEVNPKNASATFDYVIKENLFFCVQDLLLLYGDIYSGWCQSASLRHYRSWGHQHNLHSGVCKWLPFCR